MEVPRLSALVADGWDHPVGVCCVDVHWHWSRDWSWQRWGCPGVAGFGQKQDSGGSGQRGEALESTMKGGIGFLVLGTV